MTFYKHTLLLILFCFEFINGFAQNKIPKHVATVFTDLINAYGNIKIPPVLEYSNPNETVVALYVSSPKPTVKIDKKVLEICSSMGKDSLNSLSIILSHELAHYYNDHTFCYDFSFAHKGSTISNNLIKMSSDSKKEKEIQADYQGLWHALMAGYKPIPIFDKTFDKIYKSYGLPETMPGYPAMSERKQIKNTVLEKIQKLAPVFNSGIIFSERNYFNEAKDCFELLLQTIPTKENFNNAGIAYLNLATALKVPESIPFIFPIFNDKESFLNDNFRNNGSKGSSIEDETLSGEYFEKAKRYFEKSISLNPRYYEAIQNLACLHSISGNQEACLGLLNTLPKDFYNKEKVLLIKAIASFKLNNELQTHSFFEQLSESQNHMVVYNKSLFELSKGPKTLLNKFLISESEKTINKNNKGENFDFIYNEFSCQILTNIKICNNKNQDRLVIQNDKSQLFFCELIHNNWKVSIKPQ